MKSSWSGKDAYLELILEHLTAPAVDDGLRSKTVSHSKTDPAPEPLEAQNLDN